LAVVAGQSPEVFDFQEEPLDEIALAVEGALADLLLVDRNPLEDLNLVANPAKNFPIIMKNGRIYKDSLPR
jgi:hypothetical protein